MQPTGAVFATLLMAVSFAPLARGAEPYRIAEHPGLSTIAAAAVQEPKPEEQKPDDAKKPDAKPAKPGKDRQKDIEKDKQKDEKTQTKPEPQTRPEQKNHADNGHADNKGGGRRIPDNDFKTHFGGSHRFKAQRVITTTTVVVNQTRFSYSGYTFVFLDPWPSGWLLTDDCYIDYIDGGYYLLDPFHPGIQVSLNVVL